LKVQDEGRATMACRLPGAVGKSSTGVIPRLPTRHPLLAAIPPPRLELSNAGEVVYGYTKAHASPTDTESS